MIEERKSIQRGESLVGKRFGRLVVMSLLGIDSKSRRSMWECKCDCGQITVKNGRNLRMGVSSSCGCLRHDTKPNLTHGATGTPEWGVYHSMKQRCFGGEKIRNWHRYGGRGITVCRAIKNSFTYFLELIGKRPTPEMEIDRIDNDLHYSCGNCDECRERGWTMNLRWATPKQGARNRSGNHLVIVFGEEMTVAEAAEKYNLPYEALLRRINKQKLSPEEAVSRPLR